MKFDIKDYHKILEKEAREQQKQRRNKLKEELKHKRKSENLEANKLKLDKRRQKAEHKQLNEITTRILKMNINKKK